MKLLTSKNQLEKAFCQLLPKYEHVSFAVAWASHGFPGYEQLIQHRQKIARGIVGIHFYQTHPTFIERFMQDERVRFVKQPDGTFHPKGYLFYNSPSDWSCLLGSANFTRAAFNENSEACLRFAASDDDDSAIKRKLDETLKGYWKLAKSFKRGELDHYRLLWKAFRRKRKNVG